MQVLQEDVYLSMFVDLHEVVMRAHPFAHKRTQMHATLRYDHGGSPVGGVVHQGATMRFEPESG